VSVVDVHKEVMFCPEGQVEHTQSTSPVTCVVDPFFHKIPPPEFFKTRLPESVISSTKGRPYRKVESIDTVWYGIHDMFVPAVTNDLLS
jgi:hypothetical protein